MIIVQIPLYDSEIATIEEASLDIDISTSEVISEMIPFKLELNDQTISGYIKKVDLKALGKLI